MQSKHMHLPKDPWAWEINPRVNLYDTDQSSTRPYLGVFIDTPTCNFVGKKVKEGHSSSISLEIPHDIDDIAFTVLNEIDESQTHTVSAIIDSEETDKTVFQVSIVTELIVLIKDSGSTEFKEFWRGNLHSLFFYPFVNGEPDVDIEDVITEYDNNWEALANRLPNKIKNSIYKKPQTVVSENKFQRSRVVNHEYQHTNHDDSHRIIDKQKLSTSEFLEMIPTKILLLGSAVTAALATLIIVLAINSFLTPAHALSGNNSSNAKEKISSSLSQRQTTLQANSDNGDKELVNADALVKASSDATLAMLKEMGVDPTAPAQDLGCLVN